MKKFVKRAVSLVLLVMMLASMFTISAFAADECYPEYKGNTVSIVNALYAVGAKDKETTFAYRKLIAAANETRTDKDGKEVLKNYKGTAEQNMFMIKLLKEGTLKKPAATTTPSTPSTPETKPGYFPKYSGKVVGLVQALNAVGADYDFEYRRAIAVANKIVDKPEDYKGTFTQNNDMIILLQKGELKKP